jgi:hypothetical protein
MEATEHKLHRRVVTAPAHSMATLIEEVQSLRLYQVPGLEVSHTPRTN